MYDQKFFEKVKPILYISLASPHGKFLLSSEIWKFYKKVLSVILNFRSDFHKLSDFDKYSIFSSYGGHRYESNIFILWIYVLYLILLVGSRRPMRGLFNPLASWFTRSVLSKTGIQLMLEDNDQEVPLLVRMASKGKLSFI